MEFSGTFELEDATVDEVWLALSDPELVWNALPGCQFLARVEDDDPDFDALREEYEGREPELTLDEETIHGRAFEEGATYAALMEVSLGSVSPSFRTVGTVDEREEYRMVASGEGESGNSSFEGSAEMELRSVEGGVVVDWQADADVFGRIAQMGQRVVNPAANRVIKRFFDGIRDTIEDLAAEGQDDEAESADGTGGETTGEGEPGDDASVAADGVEKSGGLLARVRRLLGLGS